MNTTVKRRDSRGMKKALPALTKSPGNSSGYSRNFYRKNKQKQQKFRYFFRLLPELLPEKQPELPEKYPGKYKWHIQEPEIDLKTTNKAMPYFPAPP